MWTVWLVVGLQTLFNVVLIVRSVMSEKAFDAVYGCLLLTVCAFAIHALWVLP
jgi:hypothetical protein